MNTEKLINAGYPILQPMPDCTYFKFHINPDGKINCLEIGQADY